MLKSIQVNQFKMQKNIIAILALSLILAGCATTTDTNTELPTDSETGIELTKLNPTLEPLWQDIHEALYAGPESEVTEEEYNQMVNEIINQLETLLQSHSYEGNEFADDALVALRNSSPERHEGMGPETYEEYFNLITPILEDLKTWDQFTIM